MRRNNGEFKEDKRNIDGNRENLYNYVRIEVFRNPEIPRNWENGGEAMDQLQRTTIRAWNGILKLREWFISLIFGVHNRLTNNIASCPGVWAWIIEIFLIFLLLLAIWLFVWPRRFKTPFQPPEEIHPPHPYRLLILAGIIALVFLAACIAAE